jgi:hypothetical protein
VYTDTHILVHLNSNFFSLSVAQTIIPASCALPPPTRPSSGPLNHRDSRAHQSRYPILKKINPSAQYPLGSLRFVPCSRRTPRRPRQADTGSPTLDLTFDGGRWQRRSGAPTRRAGVRTTWPQPTLHRGGAGRLGGGEGCVVRPPGRPRRPGAAAPARPIRPSPACCLYQQHCNYNNR